MMGVDTEKNVLSYSQQGQRDQSINLVRLH